MNNTTIIGREPEIAAINAIMRSTGSHLIAVTGRRRIGKTYLIRSYFREQIDVELIGVLNANMETQLQQFDYALRKKESKRSKRTAPANWMEAFQQLIVYLEARKPKRKQVIFIDEFPWLDTHKSGFLGAFDWFWNNWASQRNIAVIICGSAASWMIRKVINHRGGLHNRVTDRIHLEPFTLKETEAFLKYNKVSLDRYQIATLYMALGGVPHYLKEIRRGESAMQAIQRICFDKKGLLANEFGNLYTSLFKKADNHLSIVKALAKKRKGLTRAEIITGSGLKDGGTLSQTLEELEWSGFIESYLPFGKVKKEKLFRLTDEYSLFYLVFMHQKKNVNWMQLSAGSTWKSWSGYTFESLCMKHLPQIKHALGIGAVYTEYSSFIHKGTKDAAGSQIDLLIDRRDHVINICEMKFSETSFILTKAYANELRQKMAVFQSETKTRKSLFLTFITTFGVSQNAHSIGLVQQQVVLDDLFRS